MKLVSNHDLNLVQLLGDDTINEIRRDLCDELNIPYEEASFSRVDEIIRKSWAPETLNTIKRDMRNENIWRVASILLMVIPFFKTR